MKTVHSLIYCLHNGAQWRTTDSVLDAMCHNVTRDCATVRPLQLRRGCSTLQGQCFLMQQQKWDLPLLKISTDIWICYQFRTSSLSWKTTSLVAFETSPMMVIKTPFLTMIACWFTLWTIGSILCRCLGLIIPCMTFTEINSVNPHTHPDIMVLSHEDNPQAHPYWYTQVLGIFHLRVLHLDPSAMNHLVQHMEVLWVWWFGLVSGHQFRAKVAWLPKIRFVPDTDPQAFGFLDPSLVIHGCYPIPAFSDRCTAELLTTSPSAGWPPDKTDDWAIFL